MHFISDLLGPQWFVPISEGMRLGRPARLPEWPLQVPLEAIALPINFLGRGRGHDVYRIPESKVALKIAMSRDPRAVAESFIDNQCESYNFWLTHLGVRFMPPTVMFAYPHPNRPNNRGCELQRMVTGRPLWQLSDRYLQSHPAVAGRLRVMIRGILTVYRVEGRLPDVAGCHISAPMSLRLMRSARLTSNIRLDEHDWPWMVDVGAWPQGFSVHVAPFLRRWLIRKWALDLSLFHAHGASSAGDRCPSYEAALRGDRAGACDSRRRDSRTRRSRRR